MIYTTTKLLEEIKQRSALTTGQAGITDAALLQWATTAMTSDIVGELLA